MPNISALTLVERKHNVKQETSKKNIETRNVSSRIFTELISTRRNSIKRDQSDTNEVHA